MPGSGQHYRNSLWPRWGPKRGKLRHGADIFTVAIAICNHLAWRGVVATIVCDKACREVGDKSLSLWAGPLSARIFIMFSQHCYSWECCLLLSCSTAYSIPIAHITGLWASNKVSENNLEKGSALTLPMECDVYISRADLWFNSTAVPTFVMGDAMGTANLSTDSDGRARRKA